MKDILAKGKASVAWALQKQLDNFSAIAEALVARNFLGALLLKKGTINNKFSATAEALAEGNFYWALLSKKGTIK